MKHLVLRSTSINRRMLLHSRASQRHSLSISSLRRHSRFNSNPCSSLCNSSLRNRYINRSSLFMFNLRRSPLRPRTLSLSPL